MSFDVSLEALLADEALRRREFPVCGEKVYLAHAAVCPLPASVVTALTAYLGHVVRGGQFEHLHQEAETGARQLAADLLAVSPEEIAFVPSTSVGLSLVAAGLPWQPDDEVVIADGDFPSNIFPWMNLERLGVRIKRLPAALGGAVTLDDLIPLLGPRTRLVSLSSTHFVTGATVDIDTIGTHLRERGILVCVDAIQSLGARPLSAQNVDFLTADAHKWLLGPQGMGLLFVRRAQQEKLRPPLVGWKTVIANKDYATPRLELPNSARRYEPGSLNALGLVGLYAALALLTRVGLAAIGARLTALRALALAGLREKGYRIVTPGPGPAPSGIVSFYADREEPLALYRRLDQRGIVLSLRDDPAGQKCLRVAPHFYTRESEIETLLAAL